MDPTKRRDAVVNLLQAVGIRADVIDVDVTNASASFAIVDSSTRCLAFAGAIQEKLPKCRCIVLTANAHPLNPKVIPAIITNPIFLVLPVTVIGYDCG
jgi:hypothetical protein